MGKTGVIIQVRTGSTRLPGKMVIPFYGGQSMFELILDRFISELNNELPVIIATTDNPLDDDLVSIAQKRKVNYFRGSENDVLLRFIRTAENYNLKRIIRVCGDNPLFDIRGTLELTESTVGDEWDYCGYSVSGNKPTILTHSGFWGEVVTLAALKKAHDETEQPIFLEHVTNFVHSQPEKFRVKLVKAPDCLYDRNDMRLTVDTPEDFRMMQEIYSRLEKDGIELIPDKIVAWIDRNPEYLDRMKEQIEKNNK